MKDFTLKNAHGDEFSCIATDNFEQCDKVVIIIHGFGSSRLGSTGTLLSSKLEGTELGTVAFDLPGHGNCPEDPDEFRLTMCLDHIHVVEEYVSEAAPQADICYFATSFGGYNTLLYMAAGNFAAKKVLLRSAAVNMPEILKNEIGMIDPQGLKKRGYASLDSDVQTIKVPQGLLDDMAENDVFSIYSGDETNKYGEKADMLMIHAREGEVVDYDKARAFALKKHIPIITYENENHRLIKNPGTQNEVVERSIAFFRS